MSKKEQWIFLKKFARLLESSLSVGEALRIAGKNIKNKKLSRSVKEMEIEVLSGKPLGSTFKSAVWNQSTIALVAVGELSGSLSSNLSRAAENMKGQSERRGRVIAALFYPAIISVLAMAIIFFLLTFVYPKITPLFLGMKTELPLSTRIIMKGSLLLNQYWLWLLIVPLILLGSIYYLSIEFIKVRIFIEKLLMNIPIVGRMIILNQLCETSFIVGSLCLGGMSITEAIRTAERSIGFILIRDRFKEIRKRIASGTALSECISENKIFPSIWGDLLIVGERTGTLSEALLNISEMHREDMDETMALLNKLIEPIMMILVGGVVGFIALSIITPMYSLTQHVRAT